LGNLKNNIIPVSQLREFRLCYEENNSLCHELGWENC